MRLFRQLAGPAYHPAAWSGFFWRRFWDLADSLGLEIAL